MPESSYCFFRRNQIWHDGYSFISTLAEDNKLAVRSLEKLEKNLRARHQPIKIITGHTGWTDEYDLVPAMCHLDYTMSKAGGVSGFARKYTLASGGPYCDCGYKKKRG